MVSNRRQNERKAKEFDIELMVGDSTIQTRTNNISKGGLCIWLDSELDNHCHVEVRLQIPGVGVFQSQAEVVWCTKVSHQFQVGISFHPLRQEQLDVISQAVGA